MRLPIALLAAATLAGCAAQPLYQWGNYDAMLYESYKEAGKTAEFQHKLEEHVAHLEQRHVTVAPGLYAELGTLYMQSGDTAKARDYFTKERDAWPESRALMDSLIQRTADTKTSKKDTTS
jgi:hypothetical protein